MVGGRSARSAATPTGSPNDATRSHRPRLDAPGIAIVLGFALSLALATWILSPRFGLSSPAPIDDWEPASLPQPSLGDLLRPFVEPGVQRFYPGWTFSQDVMWHTLGAPQMTGPNFWNLVRLALFVAAVGLVPTLLARTGRAFLQPPTLFLLSAVPAALILGTGSTGFGVALDFARLGPQEPMLVGATVCGGALVFVGVHRIFTDQRRKSGIAAVAIGWPLFVLGAFQKETGVAYLVLVVFACLALAQLRLDQRGARRWREARRDAGMLAAVGALLLIPLLWETYRVAGVGGEGANFYGNGTPHSLSGWIDRLHYALSLQWGSFTGVVGTPVWRAPAVGLPLLVVGVWLDRRRAPWLAIGFLLTGWLMLIIEGVPGILVSRYYIPTIAMFTIAAVLGLAAARTWLRVAALAAALVLVVTGVSTSHGNIQLWASDQEASSTFVARLAGLEERGCTITWPRPTLSCASRCRNWSACRPIE